MRFTLTPELLVPVCRNIWIEKLLYVDSGQITAVIFHCGAGTETSVIPIHIISRAIHPCFWGSELLLLFTNTSGAYFLLPFFYLVAHICAMEGKHMLIWYYYCRKIWQGFGLFNLSNQRLARNIAAPDKHIRIETPGKGENIHWVKMIWTERQNWQKKSPTTSSEIII